MLKCYVDIIRGVDLEHELLRAAKRGDLEKVKELLRRGADPNFTTLYGMTALHYAAMAGHVDVVKLLLEWGANPNIRREGEWTPLHYAASHGHINIVKLLLERGADPNIKDISGITPLHVASSKGYSEMVKLLLDKGADPYAKASSVEMLLGVGPVKDREWTPLHFAAQCGHVEVVKLFLDRDVDPNVKSRECELTPLHLAAEEGHADVVKLLLDRGADPHVVNKYGETPLHLAAKKGRLDVVRLFLEWGIDPNIKDENGRTPLHTAASGGCIEVVRLIIDSGADPNAADINGMTPLHHAVRVGHVDIVRLLLERGADPNARDVTSRQTPLHYAAEKGDVNLVKLLLEWGADPSIKDARGRTAAQIAREKGHVDAAELIEGRGRTKPALAPSPTLELEEREVVRCLEAYLHGLGARFKRGRGPGPDFIFEDGSVIECKGSKWPDVGEIMRQLASYYMTSPKTGLAIPADSLNIDRAYRLLLLEKALTLSKWQGRPLTVYCIVKTGERSYKLLRFDSVKELFDQVTEELGRTISADWWLEPGEKVKRIGGHMRKESSELFREQLTQIILKWGYEVKV